MKRLIRNNNDLNNCTLQDKITIDVNVPFTEEFYQVSANTILASFVNYPGDEQFKRDVVDILENDFGFEVIEDNYNGKLQKGYKSNRADSLSFYFDTYFDFDKAIESEVVDIDVPKGTKIYCFIHIRFSDHTLPDAGDVSHRRFLRDNVNKYASKKQGITHYVDEGEVEIEEHFIYRYYDKAIDLLKTAIKSKLPYWAKVAEAYKSI